MPRLGSLVAAATCAALFAPSQALATCPRGTTIVDVLSCSDVHTDYVTGSDTSYLGGLTTPTAYSCGSPYSPLSQTAGEDVYEFTCQRSGSVTLDVTGMDCDLDIYVLDSTCDPYSGCVAGSTAASTTHDSVTFTCTASTTYYIVIEAYGYTAGPSYTGYCGFGDGNYTLGFDLGAGTGCPEDCDNGLDDDYDGTVDCNDTDCYGDPLCCDLDYDGYDDIFSGCGGTDCNDSDASIHPGATEIPYDGVDQDCDGTDLVDVDGDGYNAVVAGGTDCDDGDASIYVGAPESADGADDDCDGTVDEGTEWYDDDGDGYAERDGDCNDADPYISPDAVETGNYFDDDCDGEVDEGTIRHDDDGDGYAEVGGDCDDDDPSVHPGAEDVEDGVDNDCDGETDEGVGDDADGDGWAASEDCDDSDGWANPGLVEMCDGIDNNCDGEVDEGCEDDEVAFTDPGDCGCSGGLGLGSAGGLGLLLSLGLAVRRRRQLRAGGVR